MATTVRCFSKVRTFAILRAFTALRRTFFAPLHDALEIDLHLIIVPKRETFAERLRSIPILAPGYSVPELSSEEVIVPLCIVVETTSTSNHDPLLAPATSTAKSGTQRNTPIR